ncbi:hypothetical protein Tco_0443209 [Tanacetum coccineum]
MANLEFCDKHNMVAYLKKPTGSEGFQEIVDFLNGSHIRYALTKNPTIYVSLIEKFWQTATVRTVDNGEQEITATVDGKEFTITEASVRRHLQLADVDGISVLPTTKIFDQLSLMGNMKRGFSGEHTPLFPSMLAIQAEEGEGSGHPSEPQPPPSTAQPTNEEPIPNVVSSSHQKTQTPRQALNQVTELPQTSEPIPNVPDEAVYEEWDDKVERATITAASLDAEQASGGSPRCQEAMRGSIAQTRSKRVPTLPRDSHLPRVNTLGSDEGNLKQTKQVYGAAYTKLIMKVKKLEKTVKTSHSRRRAKIMQQKTNVHTYTRRKRAVSTGSGGISTASRLFSTAEELVSTVGASMPVSTTGMVQEVNIRFPSPVVIKDKGKGKIEESEDEQIKRTKLQVRVEADEELSKRLQAEEMNKYSKVDQAKMLVDLINQRKKYFAAQKAEAKRNKPITQLNELFETTMKNVNTFVPMENEDRGRALELAAGSSQATITDFAKVGSSKRAAEAELNHEGSKRQKTNEASGSV